MRPKPNRGTLPCEALYLLGFLNKKVDLCDFGKLVRLHLDSPSLDLSTPSTILFRKVNSKNPPSTMDRSSRNSPSQQPSSADDIEAKANESAEMSDGEGSTFESFDSQEEDISEGDHPDLNSSLARSSTGHDLTGRSSSRAKDGFKRARRDKEHFIARQSAVTNSFHLLQKVWLSHFASSDQCLRHMASLFLDEMNRVLKGQDYVQMVDLFTSNGLVVPHQLQLFVITKEPSSKIFPNQVDALVVLQDPKSTTEEDHVCVGEFLVKIFRKSLRKLKFLMLADVKLGADHIDFLRPYRFDTLFVRSAHSGGPRAHLSLSTLHAETFCTTIGNMGRSLDTPLPAKRLFIVSNDREALTGRASPTSSFTEIELPSIIDRL
jgi:hypothetical protein